MRGFSVGRCDMWKRGLLVHWSLILMLSSMFNLDVVCFFFVFVCLWVMWSACVGLCVSVCVCVFFICVLCVSECVCANGIARQRGK